MISVERIDDWRGQDVYDSAGEKLGKLDEVYFLAGGGDAVFASVKHGLLGRKADVVPLAGATVSRSHVRVDWTAAQIGGAPVPDGELDANAAHGLAAHYGLEEAGADVAFETGTARQAREQAEAEAEAKARELEEAAAARRAEAEAAEQTHRQAGDEAETARRAAADADQAAAEARRSPGDG